MIIQLPWQGKDVPCAILDITRSCNAKCAYCFNQDASGMRDFSDIQNDLSELMYRRNLQAVMISGGEPTLHKDLMRIIRYCSGHGLKVILLTNGILLDARMAVELKESGCSLCFLHIQRGQQRPDVVSCEDHAEISALQQEKGRILHECGITAGLIVTLPVSEREEFDGEITKYLNQDVFSHLLLTTAKAPRDFDTKKPMDDIDIDEMSGRFLKRGFPPFAVLSGKINRRQPRWFSFQTIESLCDSGKVRCSIGLRASYGEWLLMRIKRIFTGHYDFFLGPQSSAFLRVRLIVNGLTGGGVQSISLALVSFLRGERLHFRNMALETPPFRLKDGRIEHCCDCPGAVFKDGRLKPLCLADIAMEEGD